VSPSKSEALDSMRRALRARLARPQSLWLDARGQLQGSSPADWAAAHAGSALELVVSEHLLAHLLSEPGLPLADDAAIATYARQLLVHYFGATAQRWALAPWRVGEAGDGDKGAKGASALQGLDWPAVQASLAARQVRVQSLRPAWAAVLQALAPQEPQWLRAPQAALAWVEGSLLTWLELREGQCQVLRHQRLEAATLASLGEALAELRREGMEVLLLGYGLAAGTVPTWPGVRVLGRLDGTAPEPERLARPAQAWAQTPRPDFLVQGRARSALVWPLAATGALVLAAAGWGAWDSRADLLQAQSRLASLRNQQRGLPVAKAATVAAAALASPGRTDPLEQERQRSLAEVQRLLAQPWGHLLANVEQAGLTGAPGAIHWLGLDLNTGRMELRLEGLASDKGVALQLVDRLSAAPGWGEVVLGRFQNGSEGMVGQRFELVAKLRPAMLQASLPVKAP